MHNKIAIIGTKRGVGATTLSAHIAAACAQQEPTILIDGDLLFPAVATMLGLPQPEHTLPEAIAGEKPIGSVLYHHPEGFQFIAHDPSRKISFYAFASLSNVLKRNYTVQLIDIPPMHASTAEPLLKTCDGALLVATPETFSLIPELVAFCKSQSVHVLGVLVNKSEDADHDIQEVPVIGTIPYHKDIGSIHNDHETSLVKDPSAPHNRVFRSIAYRLNELKI